MHAEDRDAERHVLDRAGVVIAVRDVLGQAAEERLAGAVAEAVMGGLPEIEDTGLRHHPRHPHERIVTCRRPCRKVSTRRVTDRHDTIEVEWDSSGHVSQCVDDCGNVVQRDGISAPVADATVFDVQRRPPPRRERVGQRVSEREIPLRPPEPAVDDHGDRNGLVAVR